MGIRGLCCANFENQYSTLFAFFSPLVLAAQTCACKFVKAGLFNSKLKKKSSYQIIPIFFFSTFFPIFRDPILNFASGHQSFTHTNPGRSCDLLV